MPTRNKLCFAVILFALTSCEPEPRTQLNDAERIVYDSLFRERNQLVKAEYDSICKITHDSIFPIMLDSIVKLRLYEVEQLVREE